MGRSRLDEVLDEMSDDEPVQRTSFDGSEGGSGVAGGGLEKGDDDEAKDDDDDDMDDEDPEKKKDDGKDKAEGEAKPKKTRPKFTENHIIGDMGIERIANTFPSICRFRGEGYEAEDLRRLLRCYKEWAFQLFPQLAFEDLLERVQKMSGKARVRKCLEDLREKERERYLAEKFGKDYADHVEEHRKQMIREEARGEEERIKRREELYGSRNTTATTTVAASSGAALPDGEIEIEDLGAAPDPEELERQRAREVARLQQIASEQARRKKGSSSKRLFDESSDEEAGSATAAARKGKGSEGSDSESSSSDDSETEKHKPPSKRARLADDDDEAASDRLRTFVSDLIDRSEHLVMKMGQVVEQAKEKCDLQNHETENIRDVVKAMFIELTSDALLASQSQPATTSTSSSRPRRVAASAAAAALSEAESSEGEEMEIDQVSGSKKKDSEPQAAASEAEEEAEEPVVETKALIDYLENLMTELPVGEASLKVVLGHVSRQFELTADDLAKIKPSVKTIVLDIASRPVAASGGGGDKEGTEMLDETAEPETVAQDPVSAVPTAAVAAASEGEMEEQEPAKAMEEDGVVEGEKAEGTMGVVEEEKKEPETIGQEKVVYSQAGIDAGVSISQGVFDRHFMGDDGEEEGKGKMMDDDSWASAPEEVVAGDQEDEMDVMQCQQVEEMEELEAPSADFAISQDY